MDTVSSELMTTREPKPVQYPVRVTAELAARVDVVHAVIEAAAGLPVSQAAVLVMLLERGLATVEAERGLTPVTPSKPAAPKPKAKPKRDA